MTREFHSRDDLTPSSYRPLPPGANNVSFDVLIGGEDLLDEVRATSFFLNSPRGTILAEGVDTLIGGSVEGLDLADRVATALANRETSGFHRSIAVGALPFDRAANTRLIVPERVRRADCFRSGPRNAIHSPSPPIDLAAMSGIRMEPPPEHYLAAVGKALERIKRGEMDKVVLARSLGIYWPAPCVRDLLRALLQCNPRAYTFSADLSGGRGERTLLGASPELLLSKSHGRVLSHPLAGSRPRRASGEEDQRQADELRGSLKDRHEHAIVVEAIADTLSPYCRSLTVPAEPQLVATPTMWHLGTRIEGAVSDPSVSSIELASALHPTPAVGGSPSGRARSAIAELEGFDRGFYAGAVGWCDGDGDGEWVVSIRCAELSGTTLRLFAGAGVVSGSVPEEELAETAAKFRTMLAAFGAADVEQARVS